MAEADSMFKKFPDMGKKERILYVLLLTLILLTLSFIFVQSSLSPSASGQESDAVAGFLSAIFPSDGFIISNLRQIAHFAEYGVLGVWTSLFVCFFAIKVRASALASFAAAQCVALIDETIQIFSGRVADVVDVWTDFLGFLTFSAIVYLAFFALIRNRKKDLANG